MALFLYNIFIQLYSLSIRISSTWNAKAQKWLSGRKGQFTQLERLDFQNTKTVWMHCASLGEFEQGRPLLEALKMKDPSLKIILTFFSPSGFEVMKNYTGADLVTYLPLDTPGNAQRFINKINPALVLWVKYEYWYHYLNQLHKRNVPVLLISGIFRKSQPFFKFYGYFWRSILDKFHYFFLQDELSLQLLVKQDKNNAEVSGDTRFDRVIAIQNEDRALPHINEFINGHPAIVAGSTWEEDEVLFVHFNKAHPSVKIIIAPHEVYEENLINVKNIFPGSIFYSEWLKIDKSKTDESRQHHYNCLIIDNVGMLSSLYRFADVCYVGGGFGADGVHNVLEPAVYSKPVLFGPEYEKYIEASDLIDCSGAEEIKNALDLEQALDTLLNNESKRLKRGEAAGEYVRSRAGATTKIISYIYKNRLLTN